MSPQQDETVEPKQQQNNTMKTTKNAWNSIISALGSDIKILAINTGASSAVLLVSNIFIENIKIALMLASGIVLVLCLLAWIATFAAMTLIISVSVIWDLILFIKNLINKHGFFTVMLKVGALGFLIGSSYVLTKAFQPGTGLYTIFRTEEPSPFAVVGGLAIFSLFVLLKKL